jgi:hypothetical protein
VAEEHKTHVRPTAKAAQLPASQPQETVIVSVKIKALKVQGNRVKECVTTG